MRVAAATATLLKRQKPIARSAVGVVARRAHGAEGAVELPVEDPVHRLHHRSRRPSAAS